jgi:oxygen-dependent protoporphyrinogen oxidase
VIGAGITGLTAALRLHQRGVDVTVLERDEWIGGRMVCTRRDGFAINRASGILPGSYGQIRTLIRELGLEDRTELISTEFAIPVAGKTHRLRTYGAGMLVDAIRTRLLSPRSKLLMGRLLRDAYRARNGLLYEDPTAGLPYDIESAADYCRRRLNEEILDRVVDPVVRGMFLVDADQVSVVDLLFMISRILGRGQLQYEGGIDFVVQAIAERVEVLTGATVAPIEAGDDGVEVSWSRDGEEHSERFDGCVIAVSGPEVTALHPGLDARAREIIDGFGWSDSIVGHFALRSRPAESALLTAIPGSEREELSLVVFHDAVAPDCIPPGKGLVSGYWMADWSSARMERSDDELMPDLLDGMEQFVPGIAELVEFSIIDRWRPVVMRCEPGIYSRLAELDDRLAARDRVQLAGDFFGYGSTNRCSITGERAAGRLAATIFSSPVLDFATHPSN